GDAPRAPQPADAHGPGGESTRSQERHRNGPVALDQEAAAALGISSEALDRVRQRGGQTFGEALAEAGLVEGAAFARALASAAGPPCAPAPPVSPARAPPPG